MSPLRQDRKAIQNILSWVFVLLAITLLTTAVANQWDEFVEAALRLSPSAILLSAAAGLLGLITIMMAWRSALAATSHWLPVPDTAYSYFLTQLGKYLPGAVWPIIAQMEMLRRHGVSRYQSALGSILAIICNICTAVAVGVIAILATQQSILDYWWLIGIAVTGTAFMLPPVLRFLLKFASRTNHRLAPLADIKLQGKHLFSAIIWDTASWILFGIHFWFLASDLLEAQQLVLLSIGAYAIAWAAGFVVIFAPAGIGVREGVMLTLLGTLFATPNLLALVIVSRTILTILDLVASGIGCCANWFLTRKNKVSLSPTIKV